MSQLDLAGRAGVSARHVSFVESGRAKPSRDMLLVLAEALDVPLRDRNALLEAGGFAKVYRETPLDGPGLGGVLQSVEAVIERMNPSPAIVLDAHWVAVRANRAAATLLALFVPPEILAAGPPNLARLLYSPAMRPFIANWPEIGPAFLQRLHREALAGSEPTRALLDDLLAQPDVPERWKHPDPSATVSPVIPLVLVKGDLKLELFTLISTLGTPVDVTLQELKIETYLPMNAATAESLRKIVG
jgi:transcriptional regulator with XRE-family HTH domain